MDDVSVGWGYLVAIGFGGGVSWFMKVGIVGNQGCSFRKPRGGWSEVGLNIIKGFGEILND